MAAAATFERLKRGVAAVRGRQPRSCGSLLAFVRRWGWRRWRRWRWRWWRWRCDTTLPRLHRLHICQRHVDQPELECDQRELDSHRSPLPRRQTAGCQACLECGHGSGETSLRCLQLCGCRRECVAPGSGCPDLCWSSRGPDSEGQRGHRHRESDKPSGSSQGSALLSFVAALASSASVVRGRRPTRVTQDE